MRSEYNVESLKPVGLADGGLGGEGVEGEVVTYFVIGGGSARSHFFHKLQLHTAREEDKIFGQKRGSA